MDGCTGVVDVPPHLDELPSQHWCPSSHHSQHGNRHPEGSVAVLSGPAQPALVAQAELSQGDRSLRPPQFIAPQCCVSTDAAPWPGGHYAASSPPCGAGTQLPGEGQARPNSSSPPTLRTCFPTPPCGAAQAPSMFLLTGRDPRALPWAGCGEQAVLLLLQGQTWASVTHQPGVFLPPVTGNQSSSKMEALPEGPPPPVSSAELQLWEEAEPGGEGSALRAPWGTGQPQHCAHTSRRATERVSCNSATLAASPERCWSGSHLSAD